MEINPSALENSEHLIILGDDFAKNFETKSFRCSFCRRGFSNAQALGGHMNIHRKDRARLREFPDENLLSLEISRSANSDESSLPTDSPVGEKLGFEADQILDEDDLAENLKHGKKGALPPRLPLFPEATTASGGGEQLESRKVEYGEVLDLELRLGPEPHDHHAKSKPPLD